MKAAADEPAVASTSGGGGRQLQGAASLAALQMLDGGISFDALAALSREPVAVPSQAVGSAPATRKPRRYVVMCVCGA